MAKEPEVLLTTHEIEGWERESVELAKRIADDQERLTQLRTKLKMAEFFRPKKLDFFEADKAADQVQVPLALAHTVTSPTAAPADGEGDNLVAAIEKIANSSLQPVSKKELKALLATQGFPAERLANYFYTAVHRLKSKDRITVMADGKIWIAPDRLEANSN
jgi:hypothetical protein